MDEDLLSLQPARPPRYDERSPNGGDLESIMRRIAALPTRRELIRFGVWSGRAGADEAFEAVA